MRLRGFSVTTNILEDYASDTDVLVLVRQWHPSLCEHWTDESLQAMECMTTWPLIQRNKVEDSKINVPVEACSQSELPALADLAKKVGICVCLVALSLTRNSTKVARAVVDARIRLSNTQA